MRRRLKRNGGKEMKKLLILGAGGFGHVIEETARLLGYEDIAFLDDAAQGEKVLGKLASFEQQTRYEAAYPAFGNNRLRLFWLEQLRRAGFETPTLIHPAAFVSPSARLEEGCAVLPKAVIQAGAVAGKAVLFNCGSLTDHDAVIGEGAHLCLGSIVKAGCGVPPCAKVEAGVVIDREHPAR